MIFLIDRKIFRLSKHFVLHVQMFIHFFFFGHVVLTCSARLMVHVSGKFRVNVLIFAFLTESGYEASNVVGLELVLAICCFPKQVGHVCETLYLFASFSEKQQSIFGILFGVFDKSRSNNVSVFLCNLISGFWQVNSGWTTLWCLVSVDNYGSILFVIWVTFWVLKFWCFVLSKVHESHFQDHLWSKASGFKKHFPHDKVSYITGSHDILFQHFFHLGLEVSVSLLPVFTVSVLITQLFQFFGTDFSLWVTLCHMLFFPLFLSSFHVNVLGILSIEASGFISASDEIIVPLSDNLFFHQMFTCWEFVADEVNKFLVSVSRLSFAAVSFEASYEISATWKFREMFSAGHIDQRTQLKFSVSFLGELVKSYNFASVVLDSFGCEWTSAFWTKFFKLLYEFLVRENVHFFFTFIIIFTAAVITKCQWWSFGQFHNFLVLFWL